MLVRAPTNIFVAGYNYIMLDARAPAMCRIINKMRYVDTDPDFIGWYEQMHKIWDLFLTELGSKFIWVNKEA